MHRFSSILKAVSAGFFALLTACGGGGGSGSSSDHNYSASTLTPIVSWNQPQYREDGTELNPKDISGYQLVIQNTDRDDKEPKLLHVDGSLNNELELDFLSPGNYYIAVAAIDQEGNVSQFSDPIVAEIR